MKALFKYCYLALMLVLFVSCEAEYDPFLGGEGVRMNVNGKKSVMITRHESRTYVFNDKDENGQSLSLSTQMSWLESRVYFRLVISDPDTLLQGNTYPARGILGGDQDGGILNGVAEIITLNPESQYVEAVFELSGGAATSPYVVKHGFFRLQEYGKDNNASEEEYHQ